MTVTLENASMLRPTIRKRILGIALGLIFLMVVTSALSTVMTRKIAHQLDELTTKYVEAYGHLARMNVRSLEQAVVVRRMVAAKIQTTRLHSQISKPSMKRKAGRLTRRRKPRAP
jgi:uncharacterized membrane protein YccC